MGYESKLFIVDEPMKLYRNTDGEVVDLGRKIDGKVMYYSSVIAMFDLSKCYAVSDIFRRYPETDLFFYGNDEETEIIYDKYDKRLTQIPLNIAIETIEKALQEDDYRRYKPCLATLKALYADRENWREIVVLHYGY